MKNTQKNLFENVEFFRFQKKMCHFLYFQKPTGPITDAQNFSKKD